jgi:plasmid stabilization system protein ParE
MNSPWLKREGSCCSDESLCGPHPQKSARRCEPHLEELFLVALNEGLDKIEAHPYAYQVIHRQTRRVLLRIYPYSVFYIIRTSRIAVLAVIHHKRNPELAQGIAE